MNNKIRKLQWGDYFQWNNLSREDKVERNKQIAKQYLDKGPSIQNYYNALKAYFGGFNPKNPHLITGEAPSPGMRNPKQIIQGVQKAKSIAQRAAKISDKVFDRQYQRAISSGNSKRVQAVRDLHFRAKAPNTTVVNELGDPIHNYHGTTNTFTAFNPQKIGSTTGDKSGFFFTDNKSVANFYSHETGSAWNNLKLMLGLYRGHKPQIYDVYLNTTKPMITDFQGGVDKVGREILAKEAIKNGNDANILQNIIDGPPALPHNVTIMRNPKHIKLANVVTYDNNGNIIPISQRDNFLINDIRYKQGGSIKSANARKWKHKDGGVLYIFQEGGKTSWWNKVGNFINNSGLGEAALNALSTYTQNKQIGASSDVAKAQVDKDKASRIQQANLAAEQEARDIQQNNINPENPNAMSGDIVKNFIKNKLLSQKMALINQESNQEKAEIDWQTQQLKNQNTTNMLSGIGNILYQELGHVGQYMGNKQQTNVNNT